MGLEGKSFFIAEALVNGEPADTKDVPLPQLVVVLNEVNEVLSSSASYDESARLETDKATVEAVRLLASESPGQGELANELVYCLIGMNQGGQKTEAFETLFPHLPPRGKVDLLNDLVAQLNDAVTAGNADLNDEVTGLVAKHAGALERPLRIADIVHRDTVFTVGNGGHIVFHSGQGDQAPEFDAGSP